MSEAEALELSARNRAAKLAQGRPAKPPPVHLHIQQANETDECRAFVAWSKLVHYRGRPVFDRLAKIANERGKAGAATAILVSIGLRKGFPDYILLAPVGGYAGLFIESKKSKGGRVDIEQLNWRDLIIEFGYHAEICAGADEMIRAVQEYFTRAGCKADGTYIDRTRGAP